MKRISGQIRDLQAVVMNPGSLVIPLRFGDSMASKSAWSSNIVCHLGFSKDLKIDPNAVFLVYIFIIVYMYLWMPKSSTLTAWNGKSEFVHIWYTRTFGCMPYLQFLVMSYVWDVRTQTKYLYMFFHALQDIPMIVFEDTSRPTHQRHHEVLKSSAQWCAITLMVNSPD